MSSLPPSSDVSSETDEIVDERDAVGDLNDNDNDNNNDNNNDEEDLFGGGQRKDGFT